MDKFLYKLCAFAILGFIATMVFWRIAWYLAIGLIVYGLFYFGFKSIRSRFSKNKK